MMTSEVTKIFPEASELNKILNYLECPEEKCTEVFRNSPNLTLHLLKTHGKERSLKSSKYGCKIAQYYCPEVGCKYCFNSDFDGSTDTKKFNSRYFTQFKYLKQHYIKVHLDKTYICDKCNKGFPTDLHRSRHYEVCGNKYLCSCGAEYSLLASLQTHARREMHEYNLENLKGLNNRSRKFSSIKFENQNNNNNNYECVKEITFKDKKLINSSTSSSLFLVPKGTSILFLHGLVEIDKKGTKDTLLNTSVSTQTDVVPKRRKALSPVKGVIDKPSKKRASTQTQTGEKRPKKTTETQTSLQCISSEEKRKSARSNSLTGGAGRKRKKSMETQTLNNCLSISNNIINCSNKKNACDEFQYSSISSIIRANKHFEESNSSDSTIAKQDICLPQLWLHAENESINKRSVKDNPTLLTELNNSNNKTPQIIKSSKFETVKKSNDNSLLFYNRQDFEKGATKESSLCHIETQTDSAINSLIDDYLTNCDNGIPEDDLLDQYTRWTQTCDDIILPDDDIALDFTNNETQTAWSFSDDCFISDVVNSETQTPLLNIEDYMLGN